MKNCRIFVFEAIHLLRTERRRFCASASLNNLCTSLFLLISAMAPSECDVQKCSDIHSTSNFKSWTAWKSFLMNLCLRGEKQALEMSRTQFADACWFVLDSIGLPNAAEKVMLNRQYDVAIIER